MKLINIHKDLYLYFSNDKDIKQIILQKRFNFKDKTKEHTFKDYRELEKQDWEYVSVGFFGNKYGWIFKKETDNAVKYTVFKEICRINDKLEKYKPIKDFLGETKDLGET